MSPAAALDLASQMYSAVLAVYLLQFARDKQ